MMRAHTWGEDLPFHLVALHRIAALQQIDIGPNECRIGAMASHEQIANHLAEHVAVPSSADLMGLYIAAAHSANPGIRRLATLGGNLCSARFPAADFIPALLCLDASVTIATIEGRVEMSLADFLSLRCDLEAPFLLIEVRFSRRAWRSTQARTPERDYPVCIFGLSADINSSGLIKGLRVATGAVEQTAQRWEPFEEAALGRHADPDALFLLAKSHLDTLSPISTPDSPAWYRRQVLPALVKRAFKDIYTGKDKDER